MYVNPKDKAITVSQSELRTLDEARNIATILAALPHRTAQATAIAREAADANQKLLAALKADQQPKE